MEMKIIGLVLSLFLLGLGLVNSKKVIWEEVISPERLRTRLTNFNKWYADFTGKEPKVEARLTEDPDWTRVGLFAKSNIQADEVYLTIDRSKLIKADLIYDTKVGSLIKALEEQYGYDDYTNFVFYLLHEMNNKDSEWKAYLDLLPRQPTTIVFKYWDKKAWVEEELLHTPILSNIEKLTFRKNHRLQVLIGEEGEKLLSCHSRKQHRHIGPCIFQR